MTGLNLLLHELPGCGNDGEAFACIGNGGSGGSGQGPRRGDLVAKGSGKYVIGLHRESNRVNPAHRESCR